MIFDGTPATLYAVVVQYQWLARERGLHLPLHRVGEPLTPEDPRVYIELWERSNLYDIIAVDAVAYGYHQSRVTIRISDRSDWSILKPLWLGVRAHIEAHMAAVDELAHIKDQKIRAAVRAYINRQPGQTRDEIARLYDCSPRTLTNNLPEKYKDQSKVRKK